MVKKHDSQSFSPLGWRQPSLGPSWNLKKAVFTDFAYFSLKQVQQISFESLIMGVKLIMGESNDYFLESKSRSNVSGEIFNWFSKFSFTKNSLFSPLFHFLFLFAMFHVKKLYRGLGCCSLDFSLISAWSSHTHTHKRSQKHIHTHLSLPSLSLSLSLFQMRPCISITRGVPPSVHPSVTFLLKLNQMTPTALPAQYSVAWTCSFNH